MNRRTLGIGILVVVVAFYTFGTGFTFFFHFFYTLLLLLVLGWGWAWINLRGLDVSLRRTGTRGQVGGYLEAWIDIVNRTRLPKSWLEVAEVTDLPVESAGRGVALVREQSRNWKIETYLTHRGVFHTGQVKVVSQDPFGLFALSRRFLQLQDYVVVPATEPLPDLHPKIANLPVDSRFTRPWDQVTTDVSAVREYAYGDSYRRIHWPYTARMNALMVKEFDVGISAENWVVLDMQQGVHFGEAPDNTEELAVTVAASLINRMFELSLPVGLAANGDLSYLFRPDSSPESLGRLMEALAAVRAQGTNSIERFLYELRPNLSRFNTLTLITPSMDTSWVPALSSLRRQGVNVNAVLIDAGSFGNALVDQDVSLTALFRNEITSFSVARGQDLNLALSNPLAWHENTGMELDGADSAQVAA
ncbi:MAG: hypothetical protein BZY88_13880 [SAR202 cluster bacterium Io17-Chloro-G9]|nr:MAG: hypothetical protein BZY88_13880 [SAR202 cluster bacterium Io17-Chloro-G9]